MTFEELGAALRDERERRGISVEAAAGRLKLMPRVVCAIEQGDREALPQAAYARGFVKAYGALLELDAEFVLAGIAGAWPEHFGSSSVVYESEGRRSKRSLFFVVWGLVPALLAFGAFWYFRDLDVHPSHILKAAIPVLPAGTETPVAPKHSPAESASRAETRSGSRTEAQTDVAPRPAAPSVEITPVAPVSSAPPSQPVATTQPPATVDPPAGNPPSPATQSRQASSAERGSEPHKLIIVALAECWVHSSTDGTDVRQFSLRKGDTFVLAFSTNLTLKLGNAGGVRLRYDGQDMPPPGDDGQVKTLNFPVAR